MSEAERPDRDCDQYCPRRQNALAECTCSRSYDPPKVDSLQDIFDAVVAHLAKQKTRAIDEELGCSYSVSKDGSGPKCAVGIFVPPDLGWGLKGGVFDLQVWGCVREDVKAVPMSRNLLAGLQRVHDNGQNSLKDLKAQLCVLAAAFDLTPIDVNEIQEWTA